MQFQIITLIKMAGSMKRYTMRFILIIFTAVLMVGCSTIHKLPDEGRDIQRVYDDHMSGHDSHMSEKESGKKELTNGISNDRQIKNGTVDLAPYTRTQNNELDNLFPLLPNPQLVMYVDPHLSKNGHPIPGYSVPFKMYEKDEYAMPGEIKQ